MAHFVVIDANNIAFASQAAAMPGKSTKGGRLFAGEQETTAINGVLRKLHELQHKNPGARLVLLWDLGEPWRKKHFPEYKGNRKDNPVIDAIKAALKTQRPLIMQAANACGVMSVTAEGFEADDLAYYFSQKLSGQGHLVTLVSRDADWLQLVGPKVRWFNPFEDKLVTLVNFELETGCPDPQSFLFAKILQGDTSDNIKGIKGLGEVTANLLASEFGSFDRLIKEWPDFATNIQKGEPFSRPRKIISEFVDDVHGGHKQFEELRLLIDLTKGPAVKGVKATSGKLDAERLRQVLAPLNFTAITRNLDVWLTPFDRTPIQA